MPASALHLGGTGCTSAAAAANRVEVPKPNAQAFPAHCRLRIEAAPTLRLHHSSNTVAGSSRSQLRFTLTNAKAFNALRSKRARRSYKCSAYAGSSNGVDAGFRPEDVPSDAPASGFATIAEAIEEIKEGRFIVVVDDEDRENEGDIIMAADACTPEQMAFMVNHTSGVICTGMPPEVCDRLQLPLMVPPDMNNDRMLTAYTITCDATEGTSTGISAADRALTVRLLADPETTPPQLRRPGHVFPLRARPNGVLERPGHTEAAMDLCRLAGRQPVGILSEIVNQDGTMARTPDLKKFCQEHGLKMITIKDLVHYRKRVDKLVEQAGKARLPTEWGDFTMYSYVSVMDGTEHVALVKGDIGDGEEVLTRVHSECLTGDIFASLRCDCGPQLKLAMRKVEAEGRGVIIYLRGHEGRGIGLSAKLHAYELQDAGRDTVEANTDQGLPIDCREYSEGAQMLAHLGVKTVKLMSNNPTKFHALAAYDIHMTKRVPLITPINPENRRYIETKRSKMGHLYSPEQVARETVTTVTSMADSALDIKNGVNGVENGVENGVAHGVNGANGTTRPGL